MDGSRAARVQYEFMEREFKKKMDEDRRTINTNTISLAREKYQSVIEDLLLCRVKPRKEPRDYRLLKRYDILEVGGRQTLIVPMKPGQEEAVFYVSDEEIFDVLHKTHIKLGHGGRDKMMKHLKMKYKNITYKDVKMYLDLCELCLPKHHTEEKDTDSKTVVSDALNSRGHIDIIDFTSKPDGSFKYILVYENVSTKFVVLMPLKTNSAEEVADKLIDSFTLLGAPSVIQSSSGREFAKKIVECLKNQWPELRIVHGEIKDDKTAVKTYHDIKNMLDTWMEMNKKAEWSQGLRFVHLMINRTSLRNSKKSPYENVFGYPIKIGLNVPHMPVDIIETATTEEDLQAKADKFESEPGYAPTSEFHYVKTEPFEDCEEDSSTNVTNFCSVCHHEGAELRKCIICENKIHIECGVTPQYYEDEEKVICFSCSNREVKAEKRHSTEEEYERESKIGKFDAEGEQAILPDPSSLCVPVLEAERSYGNTNSNREWAY